jgi:hypothetical protein
MPLFVIPTGEPSDAANHAASELQAWLQLLSYDEYVLLQEELRGEPTAGDRPMVSRANAVIDRLKRVYGNSLEDLDWDLVLKSKL